MDVMQAQSSAGYQPLYPPASSPKTSPATDVSTTTDTNSGTLKTVGFEAVNTRITRAMADAEIDKYIADLKSGQSLTVMYTGTQYKATAPLVVTPVDSSGLVPGPWGIEYRPGAANPYGTQPAAGSPEAHNINWGGFDSPQSTPQPPQIIDNDTVVPGVDEGEILILPAQDAPNQPASQQSSETVDTPAAPNPTITGPVIAASRSNLVPSTNPLAAGNVAFGRGLQPPSPDVVQNWIPSPASATPPATSFEGGTPIELTGGTVTIQHVPIINSDEASIVTVSPDGTTTLDENSATTTPADLSKFMKVFLSRVTVGANGTTTAYNSPTASGKSESSALDVTA